MLGTYRVILALMVVFQHSGRIPFLGAYAVFTFFVISGYLMTYILKENYGYSARGRIKYFLNRFLRIYPPYWGALLISLLLLVFIDQEIIREVNNNIKWFVNSASLFRNIFIFFNADTGNRLVPPSWALAVEIFYYLLMALGISKTKRNTLIWFSIGLTYTLLINIINTNWEYKYFFFAAGSLPFSTGALLYYYREKFKDYLPWLKQKYSPLILFGLVVANYTLSYELNTPKEYGFYINLILSPILVGSLLTQKSLLFLSEGLDKKLGEYSYPIYLVHIQAAVLLHKFTGLPEGSIKFAILTLPIIFVISWSMLKVIADPVERLRLKVKQFRI